MKIATTIAAITASATLAAAAGATVLAPGNDDTAPGQGTPGGDAVLWIEDHQQDPIKGVVVVAVSHATGHKVSDTSDGDGRVELKLAAQGHYALHVPNPPDVKDYGPGEDVDGGSGGACASFDQTRCVSVWASNGTVRLPSDTSNERRLWINFTDVSPEPKVDTEVTEASTHDPVAGGRFVIEIKNANGTWTKAHEFENTDGTERSPDLLPNRNYRITFTPDAKWTLVNPNNGKSRTIEFNSGSQVFPAQFRVTKNAGTAIEEPVVQLDEPETEYTIEGGWTITPNEPEQTGTRTRDTAPQQPVEQTPVEETPVEETPVEETPVEEAPVEEAPVEETPVEDEPAEPTTDELVANCFMYLELYPELVELDPGLPFWCEQDPNIALGVIAELRAQHGF